MPPLPTMAPLRLHTARLLMAVVAAAATAGSAAVRPPGAPVGAIASATPTPARPQIPGPWFRMQVTSGDVSFWEPATMPPGAPPIRAAAGILVNMDTGEILWERDPHVPFAPASLTKVLTTLVALKNFSPDQEVTITQAALGQASDDTVMGLAAGETLSVRELIEGMLLPSGDDAASAIAVDTVGEGRFVAAMNAQVAALGLRDSHFSNTSGLDDPQLYASAYDLAVIATFTYDQSPLFDLIVDSPTIDLPATPDHPAFQLENLDQLLQDYPAAVGVKPGWTGNAGACLIGMAQRDGHALMAVLLNADYPAQEEARLLDWGYGLYSLPPLLPPTPTPSPAPS
jgi:D-alanyl-D-alanine carboxypeptidase (penicillin-binding protein 5/6)